MSDAVAETLWALLKQDEPVAFPRLGIFWRLRTEAVTAQNPVTHERIHVPAAVRVAFKPGPELRDTAPRVSVEVRSLEAEVAARHGPGAAAQLAAWSELILQQVLSVGDAEPHRQVSLGTFGELGVRWHVPEDEDDEVESPRRRFLFTPSEATVRALDLT